ncbi:penicillin-binding protein 1C [Mongoliimonas terrestris]|uniref:penicillin-binding protein 1C n=1 Tax=Mongoliimonas terrestris TaxID=1709001 RepID=UPI00094970FE|nr:penicillin-binding protein 1C [Mongoliimonas terrestris]
MTSVALVRRFRFLVALAVAVGLVATAAPIAVRLKVEAARPADLALPTARLVEDRTGRLLRPFVVENGLWRLPVTRGDVDPLYLAMLRVAEDNRFDTHRGVDGLALLRAGWQLLTSGRIVSGGSTLTMQVVRLAERRHTRTVPGKVGQIVGALALERVAGKDAILDAYLTLAPFGGNLEGVRAASLAWFGHEPRRLGAAKAALLVALPQAPEARRPDRFPDAARAARNRVLDKAEAAGLISAANAAAARAEPVPSVRRDFPLLAPQTAARVLRETPDAHVVRLTLDGTLQEKLERLAAERAEAIGERVSVAVLVADIATGEILADVGTADLFDRRRDGFVDMTRAVRSPGSTLKPFIYGLAFESGMAHPETLVEDRPTAFGSYDPKNFDKTFHGTVTVRRALELSLNVPAVQTLEAVGPARLVARFRRAGVTARLPDMTPAGLAVGLGGVGLTLRDLTALYAALANGGRPVRLVERWDDPGDPAPAKPVLDPRAAAYVTDILAGTPGAARGDARVALKTGTSYGYRDAWAMGYDGRIVVGVWVGRPDGAPMPGLMGADVAVPILGDVFVRAGGVTALPPPPPGLLAATGASLPPPLRRLRSPRAEVSARTAAPAIAFPPNGARVDLGFAAGQPAPLTVQVRNGRAPFTWFADGKPVGREPYGRDFTLTPAGKGYLTVSVVDADGRADRITVFVE